MTTKNPFPGMNPFFEQRWQDAHTRLITYICEELQERLPSDLVAGAAEHPEAMDAMMRDQGAPYGACVFRSIEPQKPEAYVIHLRNRLPILSIPLRPTDADIALELQPLIDQCHERGRYHRLRYRISPAPPFTPADAAWVGEILRQHELL